MIDHKLKTCFIQKIDCSWIKCVFKNKNPDYTKT